MDQENRTYCCEILARWTIDDKSPICLDARLDRYVVKATNRTGIFRFCPFCGEQLDGKSHSFTIPPEALSDIAVVQRTAHTMIDVISALGNPDDVFSGDYALSETILYRNKWTDVSLYVNQDKATGKLKFLFASKQSK